MIKLGATYKDVITDFTGIAVGKVQYFTGCEQILLVPKMKEDGKRPEGEWFDVDRLKLTEEKIIVLPKSNHFETNQIPGGDSLPKRRY